MSLAIYSPILDNHMLLIVLSVLVINQVIHNHHSPTIIIHCVININ